MTTPRARTLVTDALHHVVPDADVDGLGDDLPFRPELELDSLDFLSFVETLSTTSGVRIDERDYPALTTIASCVQFLTGQG
ncbi:acyl carrier protein [Nocardioides sp. AN3]